MADGVKSERKETKLSEIITDENWDYISFQQSSPLSGQYETYEESLPGLCAYVRELAQADAKFMIHQTWAYSKDSEHSGFKNYDGDQMKMFTATIRNHNSERAHFVHRGQYDPRRLPSEQGLGPLRSGLRMV